MKIPFVKMHGAGNDFVVLDRRHAFPNEGLESLVARMCDRRRGIGADGVLFLDPDRELDFAMGYYNSDGRRADYCGNGARCLARYALDAGLGRGGRVRFRTDVGNQEATRQGDGINLHFGLLAAPADPITVEAAGRTFLGRLVRAGVPHFVTAAERVEWVPLSEWGSALRHHARFGADGANVDFVARLGPSRLAMRTYERGVEGETLACGSGAIASALWAASSGTTSPVGIVTAGGDELVVSFRATPKGYDVDLAGPAEVAFVGEWSERVAANAPA